MSPDQQPLSFGAQGDAVAQLHSLLRTLGQNIGADEIQRAMFGESTRAAVAAFQRAHGLLPSGAADAQTIQALRRDATSRQPATQPATQPALNGAPILVRGTVALADHSPAANTQVQLAAQDVRGMRPIARVATDESGVFVTRIDRAQLRGKGKLEDGLIAQALDGQGQILAQSEPVFRISQEATFKLVIPEQAVTPPPEYARLRAAVSSALDEGMTLSGITKQQRIFLARQTGFPARQMNALAEAEHNAAQLNIPAPILYACARQGLSTQIAKLVGVSDASIRAAVAKAVKTGRIPPVAQSDMDSAITKIRQAQTALMLSARPDEHSASLGDLLTMAQIPADIQQVVAQRTVTAKLGTEQFWQTLSPEKNITAAQISEMRFITQVATATSGFLPLLRDIAQARQAGRIRVASDLAQMDVATWERLLLTETNGRAIGAPAAVPGKTPAERAHNYAQSIVDSLARTFPTPAFAGRVHREGLPGKPQARDNLVRFLAQNPDFEFRSDPVTRYLAAHPNAFAGISDAATFQQDIAGIQRIFRLTPKYDQVNTLLQANLTSAQQITRLGRDAFIGRFKESLGGDASAIYEHATQIVATTSHLLTQQTLHTFESEIPALQDSSVSVAALQLQEELFGSLSFCACDDCRSVLSPAAYLTDLLAWLAARHSTTFGVSALDVLLDRGTLTTPATVRRPDLAAIELSCVNTNTPLPYIDLVNEILEQAIAGPVPLPLPITSPQTTSTADELSVTPEHVNEAVYTTLAQACYPLNLPYDLHTSQAETFLRGMKSSRADLLVATSPNDSAHAYADPEIVRAELGISRLAWDILVTQDPTTLAPPIQPFALWGISASMISDPGGSGNTIDWSLALHYVLIFLQQSGLQYSNLLDLLNTTYMRTSGLTLSPPSPCDLNAAKILGLNATSATRIIRFLRLWRVFGGAMDDLDRLLEALGFNEISPATLTTLADIKRLQALLPTLTTAQLNAFWSPLSARAPSNGGLSPYDTLFQNPLVTSPTNSAFALNTAGSELATPGGPISGANAPTVLAVLNITQSDLTALLASAGGPVPDVMTLANLSQLTRIVALVKALKITVSDYLAIAPLTTFTLFDRTAVADTIGFVQTVQQLKAAPLTVAQAVWLTEGVVPDTAIAQLGEGAIITQLTALQAALQAAPSGTDTTQIVKNAVWTMLNFPATYPISLISQLTTPVGGTPTTPMLTYLQQLGPGPLTPAQAIPSIRRLQQIGLLIATTGIAPSDLPYLFNLNVTNTSTAPFVVGLGWLDPNALPASDAPIAPDPARLTALLRLLAAAKLAQQLGCTLQQLFSLFTFSGVKSDALTLITTFTHWKLDDLQMLAGTTTDGPLALPYPTAYQNEMVLLRLKACFDIIQALNTKATNLLSWAVEPVTPDIAADICTAARGGFATEAAWVTAARPWQDTLREQQRDALVGYLCGQRQMADLTKLVNAATLYDEYLIDVSMNACMMTSRIKQALSSTQLFIQRAFMNMEPLVTFNDDDHKQWLWMKNYRVWEANRKVFLYPENWVQPELRDNKSSLFRDLESALLQVQLNDDNAEAALADYLNGLYQIARLEIAGYYHQVETSPTGHNIDTLHVIGGTPTTPATYYYRKYVDQSYWTAWEKIPFTIHDSHVVPIVYNGRLRLCWITAKSVKQNLTDLQTLQIQGSASSPPMQWQLMLNWSDYHMGKWSPPAKADDASQMLFVNQPSAVDSTLGRTNCIADESYFNFQGSVDSATGDLVIRCFSQDRDTDYGAADSVTPQGDFRFAACQGTVSFTPPSSTASQQIYPPNSSADDYQEYSFPDNVSLSSENPTLPILRQLPGPHSALIYGHQFLNAPLPAPFFLRDDQREFFAMPEYVDRFYFPQQIWGPNIVYNPMAPTQLPQNPPDSPAPYVDGSYPTDVILALTSDAQLGELRPTPVPPYRLWEYYDYRFDMAYHPWVCTFVEQLQQGGADALYRRWVQVAPYILDDNDDHLTFFQQDYAPTSSVEQPYPVADVDFRYGGAYSIYNWELFYHIPMLIAKRLADNQQFEDALKWVGRIFDPNDRAQLAAPHRFWRMREFFEAGASPSIQGLLALLDSSQPADAATRADLINQIAQWRKTPFNPHLIARLRTSAYQKTSIMQYLDILIGWGDQLFHQDTIETINEAAQMYLAAAAILGPRPQLIPAAQVEDDKTFADLRSSLDAFSNAQVGLENYVADESLPLVLYGSPPPPMPILYFCIPPNAKLLGYWDTLADRLFKIRNCENIAGLAQQLPLFEPPIDPALLVAATAAGISIADVLSQISAAGSQIYRFEVMIRKAHEMTAAVSALGAKLLAALEHHDAKNLELLKSGQTLALMNLVAGVYQSKVDEAQQKIDALTASQEIQQDIANFYNTLSSIMAPYYFLLDGAKALTLLATGVSAGAHTAAAASSPVPEVATGAIGFFPVALISIGGDHVGHGASEAGHASNESGKLADKIYKFLDDVAKDAVKVAEWEQKASDATKAADQIQKQIIAATTAKAIAQNELDNYNTQMDQAQAVDDFYHNEFTSADLYGWMVGEIAATYFQAYQVAYGVAQQAQATFNQELGLYPIAATPYITPGYWDSLHKGLLAGELLELDLRRMEAAYFQQNAREHEITKKLSLRTHAPVAYAALLAGGSCYISIGEDVFDADYNWHYMRRIKVVNVGVTYTTDPTPSTPLPSTINCTLTLVADKIRTQAGRVGDPDQTNPLLVPQSMVASGAQTAYLVSDSATYAGMFTIDFLKDERYFPFEGHGAISDWRILMPGIPAIAGTISDIWLQIKYTARGEPPTNSDTSVTVNP